VWTGSPYGLLFHSQHYGQTAVPCAVHHIQQTVTTCCCNFIFVQFICMLGWVLTELTAVSPISNIIAAVHRLLSLQQPSDSTRGTTGCGRLLLLYCLLIEVPLLAAWIATNFLNRCEWFRLHSVACGDMFVAIQHSTSYLFRNNAWGFSMHTAAWCRLHAAQLLLMSPSECASRWCRADREWMLICMHESTCYHC